MKIVNLVIVALIIMVNSSYAGWVDGNELKKMCSSSETHNDAFCLGFISAAAGIAIDEYFCERRKDGRKLYTKTSFGFCESHNLYEIAHPEGIKPEQAKDIVVKFLNDNNAILNRPAEELVLSALLKTYKLKKAVQYR